MNSHSPVRLLSHALSLPHYKSRVTDHLQPKFILIRLVTLTHMLHVPLCLRMAWVQAETCSVHVRLTTWIKINLCYVRMKKCVCWDKQHMVANSHTKYQSVNDVFRSYNPFHYACVFNIQRSKDVGPFQLKTLLLGCFSTACMLTPLQFFVPSCLPYRNIQGIRNTFPSVT